MALHWLLLCQGIKYELSPRPIMIEIWDKVYSSDESFFGENASHFAVMSYNDFKKQGVKKLLELGCGQGRDTIFFSRMI